MWKIPPVPSLASAVQFTSNGRRHFEYIDKVFLGLPCGLLQSCIANSGKWPAEALYDNQTERISVPWGHICGGSLPGTTFVIYSQGNASSDSGLMWGSFAITISWYAPVPGFWINGTPKFNSVY
jgi:hypothetical protein